MSTRPAVDRPSRFGEKHQKLNTVLHEKLKPAQPVVAKKPPVVQDAQQAPTVQQMKRIWARRDQF